MVVCSSDTLFHSTVVFLSDQDLNELVTLCSSSQWSERRDGIGQLHMLLESSRPFT